MQGIIKLISRNKVFVWFGLAILLTISYFPYVGKFGEIKDQLTAEFKLGQILRANPFYIDREKIVDASTDNRIYSVVKTGSGEYILSQIEEANLKDGKFQGLITFRFPNGDLYETEGSNAYISEIVLRNGEKVDGEILKEGVSLITLKDGNYLPMEILTGEISGGRLKGVFTGRLTDSGYMIAGNALKNTIQDGLVVANPSFVTSRIRTFGFLVMYEEGKVTREFGGDSEDVLGADSESKDQLPKEGVVLAASLDLPDSKFITTYQGRVVKPNYDLGTYSIAGLDEESPVSLSLIQSLVETHVNNIDFSELLTEVVTNVNDAGSTTENVYNGYVTTTEITDLTIQAVDLADDSILSRHIKDGEVTGLDIKNDTIENEDISDDAINSGKIEDETITTSDLAQTLTFGDDDFLDLSNIIHDDTAPQGFRLPNVDSATPSNPSSGEGYIAYDTAGNQVLVYDGSGWTTIGGSISLYTGGSDTSTTSSASGMELINSEEITLIRGCADTELLKWNDTTKTWGCATDVGAGGSGISTVEENNSNVVTSATNIDFLGADFVVTAAGGGEADIAIDYTNSAITRHNQTQSISGAWTFSDLTISDTNVPLTGSSLALDFNNASDRTLSIVNSGAGVANLSVDGALSVTGALSGSNFSGSSSGTNTGDQTITLTGDVTGSGTGSFATTIAANSVALSTDTTGNYVATGSSGNGVSLTGGGSEGATLTAALGALTGDWDQTGAFDIVLNNASSELRILESDGGASVGTIDVGSLSADAIYTFSGTSGTVFTTANYSGTLDSVYVNVGESPAAGDIGGSFSGGLTISSNTIDDSELVDSLTYTGALSVGNLTISDTSVPLTGASFTYDFNNASDRTFTIANSGAGTANLSVDGTITASNFSGTNTGDQNLWATITSQSGSTAANSTTDTLTVNGAGIATTAITGDTLTITATEADTLASVTGRGATTTTNLTLNGGFSVDSIFSVADTTGIVTTTANINANGGLDVDDAFVVADGGSVSALSISDTSVPLTGASFEFDFNNASDRTLSIVNSGAGTANLAVDGSVTASNISGTNTGDQTITLTGDVTGSGTGSFATTIAANSVALSTDTTGDYIDNVIGGDGITISGTPGEGWEPDIVIDLDTTAADGANTSSVSGLEFDGNGELSLIRGCGASQVLKWDNTNFDWECADDNAGAGSQTLQQTYAQGETIAVTSGEGALSFDLQTANFDIEVGQGSDTGDFRVWDGTANWILVDESADTLSLGPAAGSGITIGGTGITTTNAGALTVSEALTASSTSQFDSTATFNGNVGIGNAATDQLTITSEILGASPLSFEGSTNDNIYTTFAIADPTSSTKTITFPDLSGTVILSGHTFTGDVTATLDSDNSTALTIAANSVALTTDTTGDYVSTVTGGSGLTGSGTGEGSTPTLAVGAGSGITVNADDVAVNQDFDFTLTGNVNFTPAGTDDLTINLDTDSLFTLDSAVANGDNLIISPNNAGTGSSFTGTLSSANLTDNRTYTLQDASGTIAFLTDIPTSDNYQYWTFAVDGASQDNITSTDVLDFVSGEGIDVTRSADDQLTIVGEDATVSNKGIASFSDSYFSVSSGAVSIDDIYLLNSGDSATGSYDFTGAEILGATALRFEGSTNDNIYTQFAFADPTTSSKTVTFADASGTVILSGHTLTSDVTGTLDTDGSTALTIATDSVALGTDTTGNYIDNLTGGDGITVTGTPGEGWEPDIVVDLDTTAADGSSTSSVSGLEFDGNGELSLIRGCGASQVLKWDNANFEWDCADDNAGAGSQTLQQTYEVGETIAVDSTNGAMVFDLVSANFDIKSGEGSDTGDFRVWDGTDNWILVDESADTLTLGAAAGSGITIGGTGITTTNSGNLTVTQTFTANGGVDFADGAADTLEFGDANDTTSIAGTTWSISTAGLATFAANVNANGGLDVDDTFVIADGGVLTTTANANLDGGFDVDDAFVVANGGSVSSLSISDTSVPLTGASFEFDFNNGSDRTLSIVNSGAGTANLSVDGAITGSNLSGTNTGDQTITLTGDVTGSGTGSFATTIAANSVALTTDTTGDYVSTITGGAGLTGSGTGEGSTPTLAVGAGNGITVNADDIAVNQDFDFTFTGNVNFTPAGTDDLTINLDTDSLFTLDSAVANGDNLIISPNNAGTGSTFSGTLTSANLTADRTWTLKDADGTIAFLTDIPTSDNYVSWTFAVDGVSQDPITSADILDFVSGEGIDVTRSADDQLTIAGEDATITNKGIASFSDSYFSVSSGAVSIDDIYLLNTGDTASGTYTFSGNINADGGLDVDDAFVVADGGVLTTSQTANFDGSADFDGNVLISDTDIAFDGATTTFTTTGDLTIDSGGSNILLSDALNAGGATAQAYNFFAASGTAGHTAAGEVQNTSDVFIADDLEVDGTIFADGGITGTLTGSATDLNCTDCIGATEIADVYLLNTGDTATGSYSFTFGAGENLTVDAAATDSTGTTGVIDLDLDSTSSQQAVNLSIETITDAGVDTLVGLDVLGTQTSTDDDVIYGVRVQNLAGTPDSGNEYGFYQAGTSWDYGIYAEDLVGVDNDIQFIGAQSITTTTGDLTLNSGGSLQVSDAAVFASSGSFAGALAANGGITFDASTDTIGAHTLGGTLDVNSQQLSNVGVVTGAIDAGGATSLELPNGASPTVDAAGEIALDTDYWGSAGNGGVLVDSGTNNVALVGILTSDTCSDNQIPKFDDDTDTWVCEDDNAGAGSQTLQQTYAQGNTIDVTSGEGALDIDLQTANFDIEVGEGTDTGDFRIWDGSVNWLFVDESADTLALGAAAGGGITLGGTGITTTNAGALTVTETLTGDGSIDFADSGADTIALGDVNDTTSITGANWSVTSAGLATFAGNVNANGGLDIDDAFVVADGGVLTTSQTANFDGSADFDGNVLISDTDIAFDGASTTFTTTGDLTLSSGGGDVIFGNTQTLNIGGSGSDVAYNVIGDSTAGASGSMDSDDDLYIEGILEADGGVIGNVTGSATDLNCTDCINATEIEDIYLLNTGDTATGTYAFTFGAAENISFDAATTDSTTTGGVIDLNVDSSTTGNIGLNLDYILRDSAGITSYGQRINYTIDTDATHSSTGYGLYINSANNDATSTLTGLYVDAGTGAGTEYAAAFMNGYVGIGTATPANPLDVSYTLSDPAISGINVNVTGTSTTALTFAGKFDMTASPGSSSTQHYDGLATYARSSSNNLTTNSVLNGLYTGAEYNGDGTVTTVEGIFVDPGSTYGGTGTITTSYGVNISSAADEGGTIQTVYGLRVAGQTVGSVADYGIAVGASDTATLWVSNSTNPTTGAGGITFGSSLDTNLYRSGASALATDDNFYADLAISAGDTSPDGNAYNTLGTGDAGHTAAGEVTSSSDLFVTDDLEVDGTIFADGGITGTLTGSATDLTCTDCINATEIEDIYLLNTGDTATGSYTFTLGAAELLTIDAAATNNTGTTGVINLDLDSAPTGDAGQAGINIDVETITDAASVDTIAGIDILATQSSTDNDVLYGIRVQNLAGTPDSGNEYGIYQAGTSWDFGAYFEDLVGIDNDLQFIGAQSITTSTGDLTINSGGSLQISDATVFAGSAEGTAAVTLTAGDLVITDGDITLTSGQFEIPDNTANAFTLEDGTGGLDYLNITTTDGSETIVFGHSTVDSLTVTTDGTGSGEIVLPNDAIGPDEIFATGQADGECLKYVSSGDTLQWDTCGGGSGSLDDAYNNGGTITVDAYDVLFDLNDGTNDYGLVIDNNTASAIATALEFTNAGGGGFTNEIVLQNGESISNLSNNQINLGLGTSGTLLLTSGTESTIANSAGNLTINATGSTVLADAVTAQGQFTFSAIAIDITTGTDEALTIAPNGTGDLVIDTDSNTQVTLNGGGDGVDSLVLTDGDILLSDGDFDLSGGDFNVTLDAGDGASVTNAAATADAFTITTTTTDAAGLDGLVLGVTAANGTDRTVNAINVSLTANGTGAGDIARGLFIDLAAQNGGTETAIEIENTAAWNTDIELQNDETISNAVDGTIALGGNVSITGTTGLTFSGVGGQINFTNGETIDNDSDGTLTLTSPMTTASGDLTVSGGEVYVTPTTSSASTTEGTIYYDSDDDNLYVYANGGFVDLTNQGGSSAWDSLTSPASTDTSLTMAAFNTTFTWDPAADSTETAFTMNFDGEDASGVGGDTNQYLFSLIQTANGTDVTEAADALLLLTNNDTNDPVNAAIALGAGQAGGFDYGIDLDAATINTADIRLENSDTIANAAAGTVTVARTSSGALTLSLSTDTSATISTTTGDITLDAAGSNVLVSDPLNVGGSAAAAYNFFSTSVSGAAAATDDANDVFIQDELEVEGSIVLDGSGDINLGAAEAVTIDTTLATTTSGVLDVTGTSAAANVELADFTFTVSDDNDDTTETLSVLHLTATQNSDDATNDDNLYGLLIDNLGGTAASGAEYAIYQAGTSWDYGLYIEDASNFLSDIDASLAATENIVVSNTTLTSADLISITGTTDSTTTSGTDAVQIAFTQSDDGDATDTNAAVQVNVTSSSGDAGDVLYGININTLSGGSATETALNIGSGWDRGLTVTDAGTASVLLSSTDGDGASGITFGSSTPVYAYRSASGELSITDNTTAGSGNYFQFDTVNGPTYGGTARPTKRITLNAEYPGAVLSAFYGAGTDTNVTGTMTSDAEDNTTDKFRNYYNWIRTQATLHYQTVAVRVTLPADFSDWATSNALQVDFEGTSTSAANNVLDLRIYLEDNATAVTADTGNAPASANTWETITIDDVGTGTGDGGLDDDTGTDWDEAGETAVIYLRMGSLSSNHMRIGDIKLNYVAKF